MVKSATRYRACDLFAGCGGQSYGAELSGRVDVVLAVNHWPTAIYSHERNHPNAKHICARVEDLNIRDNPDLPDFDCLFGGIECVFHSDARGDAPINDQRRSSAWRVIDWIERFRPRWCVFENVREFLKFGPVDENGRKIKARAGEIFEAWVQAVRAHGYHVEWKLLNAADYGEATKRIRLFIVCRRGGSTEPFKWPKPTHGTSETIAETLAAEHRCNLGYYRPAASIIDWSLPCPSIFTRKRQLADKTLKRIEIGLRKFVGPFVSQMRGTGTASTAFDPLSTVTAGGKHHGLTVPYGINMKGRSDAYDAYGPMPTMTAHAPHVGMALAFHQGSRCHGRPVDQPLPTVMAKSSPFIVQYHSGRSGEGDRLDVIERALSIISESESADEHSEWIQTAESWLDRERPKGVRHGIDPCEVCQRVHRFKDANCPLGDDLPEA